MAVEIPVVVDIEGAFQDATKRVGAAIQPLQRKIDDETLKLNIVVGIDEEGDAIEWTFREIMQSGTKDMNVLRTAIESVSQSLIELSKNGDRTKFDNLLEAKVYMEDMVRSAQNSRLEIDGLAKTIDGLNARLSVARNNINSTRVNSPEWKEAVKDLQSVTAEMSKVQRKMQEMGTKAGSIDRINIKIRELTEKWDAMSRSQKFDKDGNLKASAQKVVDKYRQLTEEAARFGKSLEATARGAQVENKRLKNSIRDVNTEMSSSNNRLVTLIKNSMRLIALHSATRFIRNIREVTSEFELQRVALGSIIQDTERANSLFKEIKAAAVESPFEIKDLVTYTKQLSAYQIETEKLFSTTQELADISAGLGVDMGRLILAFGQVRAAAVLRGQELRQFTEAGIPLVDKLAQKFSDLNGRAVTTAEVFELISKRAVPFSMIEEIFNDLTSAGGAFYKMQEKQAETLLGQWNNLKDAISIMYDEMGNTTAVRGAMESLIKDAKYIMQSWHEIADIIKYTAIQFGALKVATWFIPMLTRSTKLLEKAEIAEARAKQLSNAAHSSKILKASRDSLRAYTLYTIRAARATTQWGRAVNQVKAFFTGNWIGLVVSALGLVASKLIAARIEAQRLNKELEKIDAEGSIKIDQSTRNFERLAKAAVSAADGSKEQNDAVEELVRTYGEMLPPADKVIDKLREMEGNYQSVTDAIREKINIQLQEQKIDEITSEYSSKIGRKRDTLKKYLKSQGLSTEEVSAVMSQLQSAVENGLISIEQETRERSKAIEGIIYEATGKYVKLTKSIYSTVAGTNQQIYQGEKETSQLKTFTELVGIYEKMDFAIDEVRADMEGATGVIGKYSEEWKQLKKELAEFQGVGETNYAKTESRTKNTIQKSIEFIQKKFDEGNIDISGAIINGTPNFDMLGKMVEGLKDESAKASLRGILKDFQKEYYKIVPGDSLVQAIKSKLEEISSSTGISMDKLRSYIKAADQDSEKYLKEIGESISSFRDDAKELQNTMDTFIPAQTDANRQKVSEYNQMADALQVLYDWLSRVITISGKGGRHEQDPFIAQMQERIKFMQDFKKGYEDLKDYIGDEGALASESRTMLERGLALGLGAEDQQRAANDLAGWYKDMREKAFEKAKSHGATGTMDQFLSQEIKGTSDQSKTLREFQKLIQSLWDAETDIKTREMKENFEKALKKITDEIKRSETARNFYDDILGLTGDEELAANLSVSVYGGTGDEFKERMQQELDGALQALKETDGFDVSKELEKAFGDMNFASILKIEDLPDKVREAVQKVQDTVEKHNAEIGKSYAKLLMKYDDIEQQRVDITNKYTDEIRTIHEGLALELAAIDKKSVSDSEKVRLREAANSRAAAASASARSERDLGLSRLERDYRLFFSSVGVISEKSAARIAQAQKKMLTDQFVNGQISLSRYKREIKEVNEQLKKYATNKNPLGEYLEGGVNALIEKVEEFSDSMLGFASSIEVKKGGFFKPTNEEKDFLSQIDKVLNFGKFSQIFSKDRVIKIEARINEAGQKAYNHAILEGKSAAEAQIAANAAAKAEAAGAANEISAVTSQIAGGIASFEQYFYAVSSFFSSMERVVNQYRKNDSAIVEDWVYGLFGLNRGITSGYEKLKSGDIFGAFFDIGEGFANMINPVERWEDKIEDQNKVVEGLEYQYDRLEKSIQEAFGSDYISNYNKQIEVLYAKQAAYEEQARLERAKEKNADMQKIKGYENAARDVGDQILDMQGQLAEFFSGTDLTSSAKDFANAWIDAYKEFGSTTDAMREKFNDMLQKMVENSLAAKIMQEILAPLFQQIDDMAAEGELSGADIAQIAASAPEYIDKINAAMSSLMAGLTAAGYNIRQQPGQFTGIKRNIANATEESINGLTQATNVSNFYMAGIYNNVASILAVMTGGTTEQPNSGTQALFNNELALQYMSALPSIDQNIAELLRSVKSVISDKNSSTNLNVIAVRA